MATYNPLDPNLPDSSESGSAPTMNATQRRLAEQFESDPFAGGNPRQRSVPGTAPGEAKYSKVRDASGRLVSNKPANAPFLAYQRYKEQEAEKARRRAAGEVLEEDLPRPWTFGSIIVTFLLLLGFTGMLGNFVVGTPLWGGEKFVAKKWREYRSPANLELTPLQLSAFDGSDPKKPIYLAIDGDVYDVTSSRRLYGPGGSYHMMAGRDASRAFTTGCFDTHLTHDLRGLSEAELASLDHWKQFFAKHERYTRVGKVLNADIDPSTPIPESCHPPAPEPEQVPVDGHPGAGKSPIGQGKKYHSEL